MSKTSTLYVHHAFKDISLTYTARLPDVKPPNTTLNGGREYERAAFYFLVLKLD